MKASYLLSLIMLLFITSCTKEFDEPMIIENDIIIEAPVFIETTLFMKISGFSVDEGLDAICTINDVEYKLDENGFLYIPSILMNQEGQLVRIEAESFMPAIFSVIPSLGDVTQLKVRLFETQTIETFDAADGGTLAIRDSEYTIPALSVVDANGVDYLGTVNVESFIRQSALYASVIPSFTHNILIGDDGKNYSLQTWGGHDIFLYDINGNEVFIKEGIKIEARLDISSIDNNVIPSELDVMRFDELTNTWVLDTDAKLEDNKHMANISGFGHLRWSKKIESRLAKVKFNSESGPLASVTVLIYMDESNPVSVVSSNDKGVAYFYVPVSGSYTVTTLSFCGTSTVIRNTYEENTDNLVDILDLKDFEGMEEATTIQGRIIDCNGEPIPFGIFEMAGIIKHYFIADENGIFTSQYYLCQQQETSGQVYNPNTLEYSDIFKFEYIPNTTIDLGYQKACQ